MTGSRGDVALLQQEGIVWKRNEALSGIVASIFVDPPIHATGFKPDISKWFQAQFLLLKVKHIVEGLVYLPFHLRVNSNWTRHWIDNV